MLQSNQIFSHFFTGFILTMFSFFICHAQNPRIDTAYFNICCQSKPLEYSDGDYYIYVPNIFTPNMDGLNDIFVPFISPQIKEIVSFRIRTRKESPVADSILYEIQNVSLDSLDIFPWDGRFGADASFYYGPFTYQIAIALPNGEELNFEGNACSVNCGQDQSASQLDWPNCYSPVQFDREENRGFIRMQNSIDPCLQSE